MFFALIFIAVPVALGGTCQDDGVCQRGLVCEKNACVVLAPQADSVSDPVHSVAAQVPRLELDASAPPLGLHLEQQPRTGLVIGGAVTLGSMWLLTWTITAASSSPCDNLYNHCNHAMVPVSIIPVAGPIIEAFMTKGAVIPFLVVDGFVQAAGVAMMMAGVILHRDVLVYDIGPVHAQLSPLPNLHGAGFGALASF